MTLQRGLMLFHSKPRRACTLMGPTRRDLHWIQWNFFLFFPLPNCYMHTTPVYTASLLSRPPSCNLLLSYSSPSIPWYGRKWSCYCVSLYRFLEKHQAIALSNIGTDFSLIHKIWYVTYKHKESEHPHMPAYKRCSPISCCKQCLIKDQLER